MAPQKKTTTKEKGGGVSFCICILEATEKLQHTYVQVFPHRPLYCIHKCIYVHDMPTRQKMNMWACIERAALPRCRGSRRVDLMVGQIWPTLTNTAQSRAWNDGAYHGRQLL